MTENIMLIEIMEKKVLKLYPDGRVFPDKTKSSWWIKGMKEYIPPKKEKPVKKEVEQKPLFKPTKNNEVTF